MKKLSLVLTMALVVLSQSANAQTENLFNHLGGGISLGTDGIGIDLAMPMTDYFAVRAGVSFLPKVKYDADVDIDSTDPTFTAKKVNVEGKLNKTDFKFLIDYYPFKNASFHLTAGAFIGGSKLVNIYNTETFLAKKDWGTAGIKLGDYRITSDENGNVAADVKVNSFKPYVGIGFGRAVPKSTISVSCDLGVQFWGKPSVWTTTKDDFGDKSYHELTKGDVDNKDADKFFDIMSKIVVYPVLNIRLSGRFF